MLEELVRRARSCRRFEEEVPLGMQQLEQLIDMGRLSPCGANKQYIKYVASCSREINEKIFSCLGWAGYLPEWDGPEPGERPAAYIVMLRDREIQEAMTADEGIAGQSIFLGAAEMGVGGCFLMNVQRKKLAGILGLDENRFAVSMVIALGVPREEVKIVPLGEDGDIRFYRDENQVHYVPKRSLEEVLVQKWGSEDEK